MIQTSIKNQLKINVKSMLEKVVQKPCKIIKNEAKLGTKIDYKSIKNEVEN